MTMADELQTPRSDGPAAAPGPATSDAQDRPLLARRDRALAHVTLNRPTAHNALTRAMKQTFAAALGGWGSDPNIYAIVLDSAAPRAFCAGADLAEFRDPAKGWTKFSPSRPRRPACSGRSNAASSRWRR